MLFPKHKRAAAWLSGSATICQGQSATLTVTLTGTSVTGAVQLNGGADADILVLENTTMKPRYVIAKGLLMVRDSAAVKKGYFE